MKTRAILVETSSLTKKCAGAEGEGMVMTFSVFVSELRARVFLGSSGTVNVAMHCG